METRILKGATNFSELHVKQELAVAFGAKYR
jgi:hypothetical protein